MLSVPRQLLLVDPADSEDVYLVTQVDQQVDQQVAGECPTSPQVDQQVDQPKIESTSFERVEIVATVVVVGVKLHRWQNVKQPLLLWVHQIQPLQAQDGRTVVSIAQECVQELVCISILKAPADLVGVPPAKNVSA